jgi:hypothetical protein
MIGFAIAALAGGTLYETKRAIRYQDELRAVRQSQSSMPKQVRPLQASEVNKDGFIAALAEENAALKQNAAELLRLRGEVGRLRTELRSSTNGRLSDSTLSTAQAWLNRTAQLKQYVAEHPETAPPEFHFLTDREWLIIAADALIAGDRFETEEEYRRAMDSQRGQAESNFGNRVQEALRKYMAGNDTRFPTNVTELQSHVDPAVFGILSEHYEIKSTQIFPEALRKEYGIKDDWMITRKTGIKENSRSRLGLHSNGSAYWQMDWPTALANP